MRAVTLVQILQILEAHREKEMLHVKEQDQKDNRLLAQNLANTLLQKKKKNGKGNLLRTWKIIPD